MAAVESGDEQRKANSAPAIVFYGASGHAEAMSVHARQSYGAPLYRTVAFVDDFRGNDGLELAGAPVISFERWRDEFRSVGCLIAVSDPAARIRLAQRLLEAEGRFARLYAPTASISEDIKVGEGSFVSPHSYIGSRCLIGDHVQVMPNCSVGHDVSVEDFATVCPGVNISGYVNVGRGAFVGVGAIVVNGSVDRPLVIGEGARIYAGAVVTKSVPPGVTVAGNPARPLRQFLGRR